MEIFVSLDENEDDDNADDHDDNDGDNKSHSDVIIIKMMT